jgi:hypothetical protein
MHNLCHSSLRGTANCLRCVEDLLAGGGDSHASPESGRTGYGSTDGKLAPARGAGFRARGSGGLGDAVRGAYAFAAFFALGDVPGAALEVKAELACSKGHQLPLSMPTVPRRAVVGVLRA